mmetsp:Transcript_8971/g.24253  ORF Transcript_8971/g.24253 Transcript_8971/m.24253 type:complete len:266 (-) Transcript_8971:427-1224(-)
MKHITRPGVRDAILFSRKPSDVKQWEKVHAEMPQMLMERSDHLAKTDEQLRQALQSCERLDKDLFLRVVYEWKFVKGKPRNALKKLLNSNSANAIEAAWRNAVNAVERYEANAAAASDDGICEAALDALCVLSGVGVATAAALLSLAYPKRFMFLDDEVIECLVHKKRTYTMKVYREVHTKCQRIAGTLGEAWSVDRVGRTIWTSARLSALGRLDDVSGSRIVRKDSDTQSTTDATSRASRKRKVKNEGTPSRASAIRRSTRRRS